MKLSMYASPSSLDNICLASACLHSPLIKICFLLYNPFKNLKFILIFNLTSLASLEGVQSDHLQF